MTQQMEHRATTSGAPPAALRTGDRVRVRSRAEILATLDDRGALRGMPFMPEMLGFEGRTMLVDAVVHRTCDPVGLTANGTGTNRAMSGTVHLRGARCDGLAHGGCQARCLLYWNENWLERVPDEDPARPEPAAEVFGGPAGDVPPVLAAGAHRPESTDAEPRYACQATDIIRASCFVSQRSPRLWVKDLRSGNASPARALIGFAVLSFNRWQSFSVRFPERLRIREGERWPWCFPTGERRRPPALGLTPGDVVEVKSRAEIEATLDENRRLRGLWFAPDMVPYCGKRAKVVAKVDRIVDEKTGRMLKLRDCFILDSMWCEGDYRALCRRKLYSYWREAWLRRVEPPHPNP